MSNKELIERLPQMLRKVAKREAEEGEYSVQEHIDWMAADRIEQLSAVADAARRIYSRPMHNQSDEDRLRKALSALDEESK